MKKRWQVVSQYFFGFVRCKVGVEFCKSGLEFCKSGLQQPYINLPPALFVVKSSRKAKYNLISFPISLFFDFKKKYYSPKF